MSEKTRIYPVFLPHAGCPFQCVYCNQHGVISSNDGISRETGIMARFYEQLDTLLGHVRNGSTPGELAFYGGTFTALPLLVLRSILDEASARVKEGLFTGIRFSTRPDGVAPDICSCLAEYPISTVELGAQSLSDEVLKQSRRGYASAAVAAAAARVREQGWKLGIQIMPGLPGETAKDFKHTLDGTIDLRPHFVRLYPTVVLPRTLLADWFAGGLYRPLTLDTAVEYCAFAYDAFTDAGIKVIRMGLHPDPALQKPGAVLAGPYHPAFGYLVRARWWRNRVDARVRSGDAGERGTTCTMTLRVGENVISEIVGPHRSNIAYWIEKWQLEHVNVARDPGLRETRFECQLE